MRSGLTTRPDVISTRVTLILVLFTPYARSRRRDANTHSHRLRKLQQVQSRYRCISPLLYSVPALYCCYLLLRLLLLLLLLLRVT